MSSRAVSSIFSIVVLLTAIAARPLPAADQPTTRPITQSRPQPDHSSPDHSSDHSSPDHSPKVWLLHLPGINGETGLDVGMLRGLKEGGYDGAIETYDWTGEYPGIPALLASKRNHEQAKKIADLIADRVHAAPDGKIIITSHSAGAGLCAWALECLPDDVKVDDLLLLSPALSPTYDLTKALTHVRGKAYAFTSPNDIAVLGVGTKMLGTVDGKYTEAAGRAGFTRPDGADADQYRKLVPEPYQDVWMKYDNIGDHVGMMTRPFAKAVLAPLVLTIQSQNHQSQPRQTGALMPTTKPAQADSPLPTSPASLSQRHDTPWPKWKKWLAYLLLVSVAFAAVWYVDRRAHSMSLLNQPPAHGVSH